MPFRFAKVRVFFFSAKALRKKEAGSAECEGVAWQCDGVARKCEGGARQCEGVAWQCEGVARQCGGSWRMGKGWRVGGCFLRAKPGPY